MWQILISFVCFAIIYLYRRNLSHARRLSALHAAVKSRRLLREASIDSIRKKVDEVPELKRRKIGSLNFEELRKALVEGKISCIEVLRTYQEKAIRSHEKTNCITRFIEEADEWALTLDRRSLETGFTKHELFGIPFSIKECVKVAGYDQTKGYAHEIGNYAKEDSLLIKQIKYLGGVPFVLTNVPQCLLAYSCSNPIYGTTSCVYDKDRTSGGSSGGEGALIGSGGSIIGIGSDVGGSIRYPCHFNGIVGIKPSHLRLSTIGLCPSVPGRPLVNCSEGPMATEVSALVFFLRAVWRDDWISERDPYVPPVPWNEQQFSRLHFRIGYYENDGWFQPTPALARAVRESVARLEKIGYKAEPFRLPDMSKAFQLFVGAVTVDGCRHLINEICSDIMMDEYRFTIGFYKTPLILQRIIAFFISPFFPRIASVLRSLPSSTSHLREIYAEIEKFREEYAKLMSEQKLDALICPVQVMPAIAHQYPIKLFTATSYCGVYNLLDFAAGTLRVTNVTINDEKELEKYPTSDLWYQMAKNATKGAVGLPVGVQIVAPPYHEETVLKIMSDLEKSVRDQPTL